MILLIEALKHFPALSVVIPIFSALVNILLGNKKFGHIIYVLSNFILFLFSIDAYKSFGGGEISYFFGNWGINSGIEFIVSKDVLCALALMNSCFFIFTISFANRILNSSLVVAGKEHIVYSLMLIIQSGYTGIILTNDIFNLYVFVEISSLATYPMIALSEDRKALVAAFEYLILGTIGATMILISIGIIVASSGHLNITSITDFYADNKKGLEFVITFLIAGLFTKLAIFPVHSWKVKSYEATSFWVSAFFISTSVVCSAMILFKFRFLLSLAEAQLHNILYSFGVISVLFGGIMSYFARNFRKLCVYSSVSTTGYYLLLSPLRSPEDLNLFLQLLVIDSFMKLSFFLFGAAFQKEKLEIYDFLDLIRQKKSAAIILLFIIFNAAGLPPSPAFFNKIAILNKIAQRDVLSLVVLSVGTVFSILSYANIARQSFKKSETTIEYNIDYVMVIGAIMCTIFMFEFL